MKYPFLLHIIIVTYNRFNSLRHSISSIYPYLTSEIKLTISDNSSLTPDQISELLMEYPKICILSRSFNVGPSLNYIMSLDLSEGEYTWIVCDDDSIDLRNIDHLIQYLKSRYYEVIMAGSSQSTYYLPDESLDVARNTMDMLNCNPNNFLFHVGFVPSLIYKTSLLSGELKELLVSKLPTFFPHVYVYLHTLPAKLLVSDASLIIKPSSQYGEQDNYLLRFIHSWLLMCRDARKIPGVDSNILIQGIFCNPLTLALRFLNAAVAHAQHYSYTSSMKLGLSVLLLLPKWHFLAGLLSYILFVIAFPFLAKIRTIYWMWRSSH